MCHNLNLEVAFCAVLRLTTSVVDRLVTILYMGIAIVDIWYEHVFLHRQCACLVFYTNKFNSLFKLFPTQNTRVIVATNARILFLLVLILAQ